MIYSDFQGKKLSQLGFGTMRLPTKDGAIDEAQVREMIAYAMENGVNYFDTAWPYHGGESERVVGKILKEYDRDSYYLADKYPGHQILSAGYDPAEIFEAQLEKCGVEYFDFYLLHNVYERSIKTYQDPQWDILNYFKKQKELGRIKHLGFSTHGGVECIKEFLDWCGDDMEFCQIQLNYLDWTLQDAKAKYELITARGIPVWVMEPVRGGALAQLDPPQYARLKELRKASQAEWAFRFLQGLPNFAVTLSGMSNMEQMKENIEIYKESKPLGFGEEAILLDVAEFMKDSVPCTACRYCCDSCPVGLDIPYLLALYNETKVSKNFNIRMRVDALPEEKRPTACIGCGACAQMCPQNIDIPAAMADFAKVLEEIPSWEVMCREREEAAKKAKQK